MSVPIVLEHQHRLPAHHRVLPLLAVGAARLLITLRPRRLRRVLEFARRGAQPATVQQAHTGRQAVVAVSLRCAGKGCLQRSIAAVLHCRAREAGLPGAPGYAPILSPPTPGSRSQTSLSANCIPPVTTGP